ncbi:MAG: DegT/DnrJ/EryC1/StrS family aminotransferase [Acidobacteriota bacterium]|nr:DegT/DnrJ/EryC1/StrS family aminotransferase [Acidobacteriota bacterium]
MWKVQLFELNYDERETRAVSEVLESRWLTMGQRTRDFESAFEEFLGAGQCTAVSSATGALHMALLALGIGPGDEVIVPALTFVADINVVKMVGAEPILADCESLNLWNIDVHDVERRITNRTKAVLCVHYAGYSCRMDELTALCERHGLRLIEDAAHAPGARYGQAALGTIGDIGCFSFFTNKNLSVGEGGMLSTGDEGLHARFRSLRSHGMTSLTLDRHEGRAISYDVLEPGLNYRIDEIRAALGLVQLDKLPEGNRRRGELMKLYQRRLEPVDGVTWPFDGYSAGANSFHICPVLLDSGIDRDAILMALKERGVQASIHYPAFGGFAAYPHLDTSDTPIAEQISQRELTLPLFPTMGDAAVEIVCDALTACLEEARELKTAAG